MLGYIRGAVERHRDVLHGRVLDVGCGSQPYRGVVEKNVLIAH